MTTTILLSDSQRNENFNSMTIILLAQRSFCSQLFGLLCQCVIRLSVEKKTLRQYKSLIRSYSGESPHCTEGASREKSSPLLSKLAFLFIIYRHRLLRILFGPQLILKQYISLILVVS